MSETDLTGMQSLDQQLSEHPGIAPGELTTIGGPTKMSRGLVDLTFFYDQTGATPAADLAEVVRKTETLILDQLMPSGPFVRPPKYIRSPAQAARVGDVVESLRAHVKTIREARSTFTLREAEPDPPLQPLPHLTLAQQQSYALLTRNVAQVLLLTDEAAFNDQARMLLVSLLSFIEDLSSQPQD